MTGLKLLMNFLNIPGVKSKLSLAALLAAVLLAFTMGRTPLLNAAEVEGEGPAEQAPEEAQPEPEAFSFEDVVQNARRLAQEPFVKPNGGKSDFLKKVSREQWNGISFQENRRLWREIDSDFQAGFFHPGFIFDQPPAISVIDSGVERPLKFSTDFFTYSDTELQEKAGQMELDFAGFRLLYPLHDAERMDEVVSFLGATHFRGLARHSRYGLEARGLILNPAHPAGEEFPYFRHFWLVRPGPEEAATTVYALLDSPSLTGAYKFVVTPGPSTVMKVTVRIFKRSGREFPETVGLAPLGSMYLFSEKEGPNGDWRPEVHNSDILLYSTADKRWFRRPLSNPKRLEINSYALNSPSGFGLMQQDNNFDHYQDLNARYDLRPSLWIEPVGDWGPGRLELIEIPADQDIHSNIIAFWRPYLIDGDSLNYEYKMYWMPSGVIPHQLGRAVDTRRAGWNGGGSHFIIDFEGGQLTDIPAESGLASLVDVSSAGVQVREKKLVKNSVTGGWRLEFKIKPPESGVVDNLMSARGERRSLHIEAVLKKGENFPDALTETWVYDLPY
ncbi:glucan biosynthesis protein D [Deltaproteobacteria bacterium Smac51]|nr:glucan biosynthesis protein D [Deltaproteobacteria bacterium Smac51]